MFASVLAHLILAAACSAVSADFFVAPDGNDANSGAHEAPFASLDRARIAVRERIVAGINRDVTVVLRGGAYQLSAPVVFGPEDTPPAPHRVIYMAAPGETVVISGGREITGWQSAGGDRWTATLPDVASGAWYFRQLFADGARLPRGRHPNGDGLLRVQSVNDAATEIVLNEKLPTDDLGQDAELVVYQNWSISRVKIRAAQGDTLRMANPVGWMGHGDMTTTSPGKPAYVENALAFTDAPGEWHLDRKTGVLTYQAQPGEDPATRRFIAPRLEQLLVVSGRPDAPAARLHFQGIEFAHTDWPLPAFGYLGIQAGHHGTRMEDPAHVLPPAILFAYAQECALDQCRFVHLGACGVGFGAGCRDNAITGGVFDDIGGNGIMNGWRGDHQSYRIAFSGDASLSADWKNPDDVPQGQRIEDNTLTRCGAVNHGCVAIFDAFTAATQIRHNHVHDMPYTGISIGFRWNTSPTSQRECLVEYNHIHDVMKLLADGGGIYTLGLQPGTVLRGNLIYDVHRSAFAHGGAPNNGIFFDEGSKGFLIEGNIIYNTSGESIRFNQTNKENLEWKDNHFGVVPTDPAFPHDAARRAGPRAR